MRNIPTRSTFVHGLTCCTSARHNAYIIVYLQFLPCKNYSGLRLGLFFRLFLGFLLGMLSLYFYPLGLDEGRLRLLGSGSLGGQLRVGFLGALEGRLEIAGDCRLVSDL